MTKAELVDRLYEVAFVVLLVLFGLTGAVIFGGAYFGAPLAECDSWRRTSADDWRCGR